MKRLDETVVKVGDVVLTTATAAISKAIRMATRSDISHAMIYVEDCSVIDATAEGVQARNTQRLFFEDDCVVHVLRLRSGLTADQARGICAFVRGRVGAQYSKREAIRTVLGGTHVWSEKQFCSRLVAQAYASVGVDLVGNANYCSPADIKGSPVLVQVADPTVVVTTEEEAVWKCLLDMPQMMRDATNAVLDAARTRNGAIQSFEDLTKHLMKTPSDDGFICDALRSSGYLTLWEIEKTQNAWQYDIERMKVAALNGGIEEYCWNVLSNGEPGPNRYVINRGGYTKLAKMLRLGTFECLAELYERLAHLHRTRVEVASAWLEANGLLAQADDVVFLPHTTEWFEALSVWDPTQAALTRQIIALAGRPEVCSVCGDGPAGVYRLPNPYRAASGVDTLRLCDDCLGIRHGNGEPFEPFASKAGQP